MKKHYSSYLTEWMVKRFSYKTLLLLFTLFIYASAFQIQGQTIVTDKNDYSPGDTVIISGTGWRPGETVNLHIEKVPPATGPLDLRTVSDAGGSIRNAEYIVMPEDIGVTFTITATGLTSGLSAQATFTDAVGDINKVYQHWADQVNQPGGPSWQGDILSANKSDYFEGEVIPHVFVYKASNNSPLTNGSTYTFNITYNYYQQNTNAGGFAFITTYNISRTPGPLNATNPYITPSLDATFTNGGGMQGSFYTVDADITNVTAVTYTGTGTKDGHVTVTFTYTGTTTTNGIAEIYYGLYIAEPGQVPDQGAGKTIGAHAWTGGSLQTTIDINGSGATSIQLSPDAIIAGKISGYKWNDLNANGVKDGAETFLSGWTIQLSSDASFSKIIATATTDVNGYFEFSVTPDADKSDPDNDPYYVREVLQSGWTQTAPSTGYYGPLTITALTPEYINNNFGNRLCTNVTLNCSAVKSFGPCISQTDLNTDFATWKSGFSYSGGTSPVTVVYSLTLDGTAIDLATLTPPSLCGGSVTVYAKSTDGCGQVKRCSGTYTVNAPASVVITRAVDKNVKTCDLENQAAADSVFADWLKTASVSGGCKPTSTPDVTTAPPYCGGNVKVTWTIADQCYTSTTYSATFTIDGPPAVIVTKAVDKTVSACDITDQAAADKLFADWLATASVSGGCDPKSTPDVTKGPEYCGGSVKVTWTITDKCYTESTYSATFTINKPADVIVTKAVDKTVSACDITDQAAADKLFADWLATASVSGGCDPKSTPDVTKGPEYCGGSVKVTWTITDKCYTESTYSATFTINKPADVIVTKAVDKTVSACDIIDQAAADKLFADWLATASVSGGCDPKSTPDLTKGPEYCGGSVKVTWTITDKCYIGSSYSATFTISAPAAVNLSVPEAYKGTTCMTQTAIDAAFTTWLTKASFTGGCNGKLTNNASDPPKSCGGSVTVTFTVTSNCASTVTKTSTFTIPKPTAVDITAPANKTISACGYSMSEIQIMYETWLDSYKVTGGCSPKVTDDAPDFNSIVFNYGASVTVIWTATDGCSSDNATATFNVTPCCNTAYGYYGASSTCFLDAPYKFDNWGWTTQFDPTAITTSWTLDLYSGAAACDRSKGVLVGQALVTYSNKKVTVKYTLNEGYGMTEAHVYVGSDPYPKKNGKYSVAPGSYTWNSGHLDHVGSFTTPQISAPDPFYLIIHANVCEKSPKGEAMAGRDYQIETAPTQVVPETGIDNISLNIFPNPFSVSTKFEIGMTYDSHVKLEIFTTSGMPLGVLLNEDLKQGDVRTVEFDASGRLHSVYIYRLTTDREVKSGTIMKTK